jgi:hypothetical protein
MHRTPGYRARMFAIRWRRIAPCTLFLLCGFLVCGDFVWNGFASTSTRVAMSPGGRIADAMALAPQGSPRATSSSNLIDHGGPVFPASHIYVIWWGQQSKWPTDAKSGIESFLQGLNGSSYVNTATQYMRGASISTTYEATTIDTSPPSTLPLDSVISAEIQKEFGAVDPLGLYIIYASNNEASAGFCGFHAVATVNGRTVPAAFILNPAHVRGCSLGNPFHLAGSKDLRSIANLTAHEFMEAITDPEISPYPPPAWQDSSGNEMADKCAWTFARPVTLSNGSVWQLQMEWSNAVSGCVQTT